MSSRLATHLTALLLAHALAPAIRAEGPTSFQLANGLDVILRPAPGARQAALVVLYSLGGDHDPRGRSGLAHLVEHVYVTAAACKTKARTVEEYTKLYPKGWNAQTGDRYTVFATCFADTDLDRELDDAAARMGDLRVASTDLDREKPRIDAELANMFGRFPQLGAMNHARELVRPTPLGGRKGGVVAHVRAATVEEVQERWRRYYKPKNALLVLASGFDAASARKAIEARFGKLPGGDPAPALAELDKPRAGTTRTYRVKPASAGLGSEACLAIAAPAPDSELYAAYLVLVARLVGAAQKLDTSKGRFPVHCPLLDDPNAVFLTAPVGKAESPEDVVKRLRALVEDATKPALKDGDIATLKATFGPMLGLADLPDAVASTNPYFVAFTLGRRRQLRLDPAKLNAALSRLRDEDLRRVAKEVFGADRSGAAIVTPAGE